MTINVTEKEAKLILRGLSFNAQHWYDLMNREDVNKESVTRRFGEALNLIEKVREQINEQFEKEEEVK